MKDTKIISVNTQDQERMHPKSDTDNFEKRLFPPVLKLELNFNVIK